MPQSLTVFATTLAVTAGAMLAVWGLSVAKRDASIVDVFWGLGFVMIAAVAFALGTGYPHRKLVVMGLTTAWGLRLALYLLWRNWGAGEDYRYRAMRAHHGARFSWVSLSTVFALQGVLMWLVSLPLQVAVLAPLPDRLTWLDGLGAATCTVGLFFEAVGDWQLARFKAVPATRGKVLDRGLWAYTRHPNYFGDALVWWGLFLIALATPAGVWTVVSPLTMTYLLLALSGVPLLERKLIRTRPEYRDYVQRTSAFVPWIPKRRPAPMPGREPLS